MAQLAHKRTLDSPTIPDRLYFKIGDVARLCEVQTYVLRFWETQFPQLKPNKSGTGQRLYRRGDVELALKIKQLVHVEGFTLAGARQMLEDNRKAPRASAQPRLPLTMGDADPAQVAVNATIGHIRAELREIAGILASTEPQRRRARVTTMPASTGLLFPA